MKDEYLYAKAKEILKMFEEINVDKKWENNFSEATKTSKDIIKKTLIKSKYTNLKDRK